MLKFLAILSGFKIKVFIFLTLYVNILITYFGEIELSDFGLL
jgi:hypothetical protein